MTALLERVCILETKMHAVEEFQEHCSNSHIAHADNDDIHKLTEEKHLELINQTLLTQSTMAESLKSLSNNIQNLSFFITINKDKLEDLVAILTGIRNIKSAIFSAAAVITAIGTILGAIITMVALIKSPQLLESLLNLGTLI